MIDEQQAAHDGCELEQDLTKHVVTRWYRPPEIILLEHYDYQADVWSLGCVFAEILGMMGPENLKGPLFPGRTCYPLTPAHKFIFDDETQNYTNENLKISDKLDQMNLINGIIGRPSRASLRFVAKKKTREYVYALTPVKENSLAKLYPLAPPAVICLLRKMLAFSPEYRIDIEEALHHKIFAQHQSIALSASESATPQMRIDFDSNHLHLDKTDLIALFEREMSKFHAPPHLKQTQDHLDQILYSINILREQDSRKKLKATR